MAVEDVIAGLTDARTTQGVSVLTVSLPGGRSLVFVTRAVQIGLTDFHSRYDEVLALRIPHKDVFMCWCFLTLTTR